MAARRGLWLLAGTVAGGAGTAAVAVAWTAPPTRSDAGASMGVAGAIGNTPLIELRSLSAATGCRILAKVRVPAPLCAAAPPCAARPAIAPRCTRCWLTRAAG